MLKIERELNVCKYATLFTFNIYAFYLLALIPNYMDTLNIAETDLDKYTKQMFPISRNLSVILLLSALLIIDAYLISITSLYPFETDIINVVFGEKDKTYSFDDLTIRQKFMYFCYAGGLYLLTFGIGFLTYIALCYSIETGMCIPCVLPTFLMFGLLLICCWFYTYPIIKSHLY